LGRPHVAVRRALPVPWVRRVASAPAATALHDPLRVAGHPFAAWLLHAVVLWAWHVPALFEAALRSETVHALQHASFLGSAVWFWWSVFQRAPHRALGYG